MDWNLAVERNREALKCILAMLVAMVRAGRLHPVQSAAPSPEALVLETAKHPLPSPNLPRHLHRLTIRLLRPAELATRRLIIVAARGLTFTLPKPRKPATRPRRPALNRSNGFGTGMVIRQGPLPEWARALAPKRYESRLLSLLDPMRRFARRRDARPSVAPRVRLLGGELLSQPSISLSRHRHARRRPRIR